MGQLECRSHTLWTRADGEMVKGSTFNGSVVAGIKYIKVLILS